MARSSADEQPSREVIGEAGLPDRRRRPLEDVLEDLRRNTGKQFDAEIVAAFCRAFLKEMSGETTERRITNILSENYVQTQRIAPLLTNLLAELDAQELTVAENVS